MFKLTRLLFLGVLLMSVQTYTMEQEQKKETAEKQSPQKEAKKKLHILVNLNRTVDEDGKIDFYEAFVSSTPHQKFSELSHTIILNTLVKQTRLEQGDDQTVKCLGDTSKQADPEHIIFTLQRLDIGLTKEFRPEHHTTTPLDETTEKFEI